MFSLDSKAPPLRNVTVERNSQLHVVFIITTFSAFGYYVCVLTLKTRSVVRLSSGHTESVFSALDVTLIKTGVIIQLGIKGKRKRGLFVKSQFFHFTIKHIFF